MLVKMASCLARFLLPISQIESIRVEIPLLLDKRAVQLDDVIKVVGEVLVLVKLHTDVTVEVTVSVEAAQS